ncbi:MAG: putative F420-0 ABC transporter substrate-binding protein [Rhodoglobus sp.]
MNRLDRMLPALVISALAFTLAGCTIAAPAARPSAAPSATIDPANPVTVKNCGTAVTFAAAPKRVVTIKSTSTEMLLALGLGNRIVGTAYQDGPVPDEWASDAANLPSIADKVPSEEVVLGKQPDLIYSGWESAFTPDAAGARDELAGLGVETYVSPSACQTHDQPKKLTFDNIFGDITQVASIFRVDPSTLLSSQKAALKAIKPDGQGRTAFWYSSGSDTPYAGAGIGAPELVMQTAGLKNIAANVDATWAPYNWESVVAADPDFIVLIDASWSTVAKKMAVLQNNPATANLTAVKNGRFIILPFASSEAGVRSVEAVKSVVDQINDLDGK